MSMLYALTCIDMKRFLNTILLAASSLIGYSLLKSLFTFILGTDDINEFWNSFIVGVILVSAIMIAKKDAKRESSSSK